MTVSNGAESSTSNATVHVRPFIVRAGKFRASQTASTGGASAAGTKNFTITGGSNFIASGVAPGDTLFILDGVDYGFYRINKVSSNTALIVNSPMAFIGSTPASWTILNEFPYFLGYGTNNSLVALVIGTTTGALTYSWTGAPAAMPLAGATTNTITFTTPKLPALLPIPLEPSTLGIRSAAMGRYQFNIKVTDDVGTAPTTDDVSDSDDVTMSCGQANNGTDNVAVGDPVFLSGGGFRKQESASSFALEAGQTYTYKIAEAATVRSMREKTKPIVQVTSVALVEATPGSWYWSAGTLWVHASDNTSPKTNGFDYQAWVADYWNWDVTDPSGASVSLSRPDKTALGSSTTEQTPFFVPTKLGQYTVVLVRGIGSTVDNYSFFITVGQYVGVGTIVGTAPDPAKGQCGSCHGGSINFLENMREEWQGTLHSRVLKEAMDPADADWPAFQAKEDWRDINTFTSFHNTGVGTSYSNQFDASQPFTTLVASTSTSTGSYSNAGFDDRATVANFNHVGLTWDDLKNNHPDVAAFTNVQCEACHGPGSQHIGDTKGIRKSYDEGVCARCHSFPTQWDLSAHAKVVVSPGGNSSCIPCHEASGSVEAMKIRAALPAPRKVFSSNDPSGLPPVPEEQRRAQSCAVCHNPHKPTEGTPEGGSSQQLRLIGQVKFMDGTVVEAGRAAACFMCHQSRKDTTDYTPGTGFMATRVAPHDSTAAEMLTMANAVRYPGWNYKSAPHGLDSKFIVPGQTENARCITCHMNAAPTSGQSGYQALGSHTWNMSQGGDGQGNNKLVANETTHTGGVVTAGTKLFTVSTGASFLTWVVVGDKLTLANGSDAGTYVINSVNSGYSLTVTAAANFNATTQATSWTITSVPKYHTNACAQCHPASPDFEFTARADYDGNGVTETVQKEVAGIAAQLLTEVLAGVNDAALPKGIGGGPYTLSFGSKVSYVNAAGTSRTFPGPAGAGTTQQTDWDALTPTQQARWEQLYKAAYDYDFNKNDNSGGIHNTGFAVNILQAAYFDLKGVAVGAPYVPPVGYEN
ncbi:MAG: hypothetical protein HY286_12585 [Planctomycetes bacterium]|nr:hypothetical protein [Planctomycetota bacterium]